MDYRPIEAFVREKLGGDHSGHDVHHCLRVRRVAEQLAARENGCDEVVVVCAALLHDVPDKKLCPDVEKAKAEVIDVLKRNGVDDKRVEHIMHIIDNISFKGFHVDTTMSTIEGKVVQDADRLDAIGAIGVARCFAYGGSVGSPMYGPEVKPELHTSEEAYRGSRSSSIAHFYEKLLHLKDRMQTESGRKVAEKRHAYLEGFLTEFLDEWDGKDV